MGHSCALGRHGNITLVVYVALDFRVENKTVNRMEMLLQKVYLSLY